MPEYIMHFDIDDCGKWINAKRKQKIIRCKDCMEFDFCEKQGCKENDFCSYAKEKKEKHYCNSCRYKNVSWREDPCRECMRGESRWEKE